LSYAALEIDFKSRCIFCGCWMWPEHKPLPVKIIGNHYGWACSWCLGHPANPEYLKVWRGE